LRQESSETIVRVSGAVNPRYGKTAKDERITVSAAGSRVVAVHLVSDVS
jgi:hypothetical protein